MTEYLDRYPTMHEYAEGKRINPKLTDYISRADAIEAVCDLYRVASLFSGGSDRREDWYEKAEKLLSKCPSAETHEIHTETHGVCSDLISRADALMELNGACSNWQDDAKVAEIIHALPSTDAVPTVIRAKTFMRKEDFDKWAEDIKKQNKSIVCIPCDAEVVSTDAIHGEWVIRENGNKECSLCGHERQDGWDYFCGYCGARMKGGDTE